MKTKSPPEKGQTNRLFEGHQAACDATGISMEVLKFARANGCEAFQGKSRVRELPLVQWCERNAELISKRPKGIREKIWDETWRKLRLANESTEKLSMLRSDHDAALNEQAREASRQLYTLPAQFARTLAGLPPVEIEKVSREMICAIVAKLGATKNTNG
jgi:hypothetical protein